MSKNDLALLNARSAAIIAAMEKLDDIKPSALSTPLDRVIHSSLRATTEVAVGMGFDAGIEFYTSEVKRLVQEELSEQTTKQPMEKGEIYQFDDMTHDQVVLLKPTTDEIEKVLSQIDAVDSVETSGTYVEGMRVGIMWALGQIKGNPLDDLTPPTENS
jgi:hypothetical protein